jgi:hypothetical protein
MNENQQLSNFKMVVPSVDYYTNNQIVRANKIQEIKDYLFITQAEIEYVDEEEKETLSNINEIIEEAFYNTAHFIRPYLEPVYSIRMKDSNYEVLTIKLSELLEVQWKIARTFKSTWIINIMNAILVLMLADGLDIKKVYSRERKELTDQFLVEIKRFIRKNDDVIRKIKFAMIDEDKVIVTARELFEYIESLSLNELIDLPERVFLYKEKNFEKYGIVKMIDLLYFLKGINLSTIKKYERNGNEYEMNLFSEPQSSDIEEEESLDLNKEGLELKEEIDRADYTRVEQFSSYSMLKNDRLIVGLFENNEEVPIIIFLF